MYGRLAEVKVRVTHDSLIKQRLNMRKKQRNMPRCPKSTKTVVKITCLKKKAAMSKTPFVLFVLVCFWARYFHVKLRVLGTCQQGEYTW